MLNKEQVGQRILFSKLAFFLLVVAVIPVWPYFFYQLLKFFIFGAAVFSAYLFSLEKNKKWMWTMIIIAIIFNPVNPLYFGSFLWSVVDIIVAFLFLKSLKMGES